MIVTTASLTLATAQEMLRLALQTAADSGWRVAVCVCDPAGAVLASARMDGVAPPILTFAEDKAYTAATMRRATDAFAARMEASPALRLGLTTRARLLPWGGGLPVVHQGTVVGGIGVSGAKDFEDIACGKAALAALGLGFEV